MKINTSWKKSKGVKQITTFVIEKKIYCNFICIYCTVPISILQKQNASKGLHIYLFYFVLVGDRCSDANKVNKLSKAIKNFINKIYINKPHY